MARYFAFSMMFHWCIDFQIYFACMLVKCSESSGKIRDWSAVVACTLSSTIEV